MSLSVSLSNALTGMQTTQSGLDVLSRNVANSGTPGYHRQSLTITEQFSGISTFVRQAEITRAFSAAIEQQIQAETARTGFADVKAEFLRRLELHLGLPGEANSLDTRFADFQASLQQLATSPDDHATRTQALAQARTMAETLTSLSGEIQTMRRETEVQIDGAVAELNRQLQSLERVNSQLSDTSRDDTSRAALMDERDRLVTGISEYIDIRAAYRDDGQVALYTNSGIGLIDGQASTLEFSPAGNLSPLSLWNRDDSLSGVGNLKIVTPTGFEMDLLDTNAVHSGRLAALIDLRDDTLVTAQAQLDEIAAALALSMSTVETGGTAVSSGGADGFEVDLAALQPGNDFVVTYTEGGTDYTVRVVRVDDPAKLPMDSVGPNGVRTIGLDFSGGIGAVATALDTALGAAISVSNPSGTTIRILDDGAAATSDINALTARATATGTQGEGLGLSLFVDASGQPFTDSLDGDPQKLGFAARIMVNPLVRADPTLLVKYETDTPLGDALRPQYLIDRLNGVSFGIGPGTGLAQANSVLNLTARQLVEQVLDFQGNQVSAAESELSVQRSAMESLALRAEDAYGVDIDAEMARLIQLEAAYSANARIVSIVKDLIDTLMAI